MTERDSVPFLRALSAVAEIFEKEVSDAAQTLWFDALKDLALTDCLRALSMAAQTKTFMPRPAEIRELVVMPVADPELAAESAWQDYKQRARQIGAYETITLERPLAETLLAVFGSWEAACWTSYSPEMWTATRKEFGRVYRLMCQKAQGGVVTLDGFCARMNRERYGLPDPLHAQLPEVNAAVKLLTPPMETRALADDERELLRDQWRVNVDRAIAAAVDVRDGASA